MTYAKLLNNNFLEYPPQNKGSILNYNLDTETLLKDGYKPVIFIKKPTDDRMFEILYQENLENIVEVINYLESEDEYQKRKTNEELQLNIDLLISNIQDLDFKRIRALCEPSIKDDETGETWLDYYNAQISDLRNQLQDLQKRIIQDDITN